MTALALIRSSAAVRPRRRRSPALGIGLAVIAALIAFAVLGPVVSGYDSTALGETPFAPPSGQHWLGTDNLGRDTFTRLALATRYMILVSLLSTLIALVVGTVLALVAGYAAGVADLIVMRGVEVLMSIPAILMALVVRVIVGPGFVPLVIAMAIVSAPLFARVMRGPVLLLRERDFVIAAEISGVPKVLIAVRHLLPNTLTPMLVQAANTASLAVLLEASLSYLGQGAQPPDPSAGRMISEFQRFMQDQPQLVLLPALLVTILTVGWNLIADGLQARLTPRSADLHVPISTSRTHRTPEENP